MSAVHVYAMDDGLTFSHMSMLYGDGTTHAPSSTETRHIASPLRVSVWWRNARMQSRSLWRDPGLPARGDEKSTVWSLSFKPDGSEVVVAVSSLVLVYSTDDGDLKKRLRGHKDTVYAVDYAKDARFASGGADNTVIIWSSKGEGILKFTHAQSIQCVAFNPKSDQLVSGTAADFGLWSKEQRSVTKHKMSTRVLCVKWSSDGVYLAMGLFDGRVQIRDKTGAELASVTRAGPVWCVAWDDETLVVGAWDETLSFWTPKGEAASKERKLNMYPCSMCFMAGGLVISGSDKKATLYTREGVHVGVVCENPDDYDWTWSIATQPRATNIAVGSYAGSIALWHTTCPVSFAISHDRIASCDAMTDVVVHHAASDRRVRIKSRDHVLHVAVYRDRLAIQIPDRVNIYEADEDNHYRLRKDDRTDVTPGSCLCLTAKHIGIARGNKLELHLVGQSRKERQWVYDANVSCLRVDGLCPYGKEGLIVGLENGHVVKNFVDSAFGLDIFQGSSIIRKAELDADRRLAGVLDDTGRFVIVDLASKKIEFEHQDIVGFAFQSIGTVCFSTSYDRDHFEETTATGAKIATHRMKGTVVGALQNTKLVVLHEEDQRLETLDISQSQALAKAVEEEKYDYAHQLACLGVTDADWKKLALAATKKGVFRVAKNCFSKIQDLRGLELLDAAKLPEADALAYSGKYQEAASVFVKNGQPELAIELFADLRQWDEAKTFAASSTIDTRDLVRRQAEWAEEVGDWATAADLYVSSKESMRAVRVLGDHDEIDKLAEIARNLQGSDVLRECARYFLQVSRDDLAKDIFDKLGDSQSLLQLYVRNQQWKEALALADGRSDVSFEELYVPYAEFLAEHDRFDEALDAYRRARRPEEAARMMRQLTRNAVVENRFKDASYSYWLLATERLRDASERGGADAVRSALPEYQAALHRADLYYAYSFVESYFLPFTAVQPDVLFNAARFLVNSLGSADAPHGVSRAKILYTLAKQAKTLGAFKLARFAYDKLAQTKIPDEWIDDLDVDMMTIHAKPVKDSQDLLPVCYRCGAANALLNRSARDACAACSHPFVRSFLTFEILPLIEFLPEPHISDERALSLIREPPPKVIHNDDEEDLFTRCITRTLSTQDDTYLSVTVGEDALRALRRDEVYVCAPRHNGMRATFYKAAIPDVHLAICQHRFYHEEDFEFAVLREGRCPYSRVKDIPDTGPC